MNEAILQQCMKAVKAIYDTFDASHDWQHIERVRNNARAILKTEEGDPFIVELAVLLHDVSDKKYTRKGEDPETEILEQLDLSDRDKERIRNIIRSVSFNGGNEEKATSIEAAIVRDADRLDAIGAVGIARTFAYGGAKGRKLYDLDEKPRTAMTAEEYRTKETASVTHFHEKLLLLKDKMLTEAGKRLAQDRHQFMVSYLQQLQNELDGNA
ncbi:HD domain-containing protein [Planococcus lenghuensis]|uniref:Phosphohydrolase n=1 Tax=Planococcus lenghuensis TaxID=2213202 RepID=A0A1Q2L0F3_9BACL|nr:HD domain-containing protein [Planococcus lenghuensis]AQQ53537.1 phosphohydrolase [Planococcus lenghuensis]